MINRVLPRLRMFLPALAVFILLGELTPSAAVAWMRYERSDQSEGDPGDGVLDPAVKGTLPGSNQQNTVLLTASSDGRRSDTWPLPLGTLYLVPLQLPGGLLGSGPFVFLPRAWWRDDASVPRYEGRWHNAP